MAWHVDVHMECVLHNRCNALFVEFMPSHRLSSTVWVNPKVYSVMWIVHVFESKLYVETNDVESWCVDLRSMHDRHSIAMRLDTIDPVSVSIKSTVMSVGQIWVCWTAHCNHYCRVRFSLRMCAVSAFNGNRSDRCTIASNTDLDFSRIRSSSHGSVDVTKAV